MSDSAAVHREAFWTLVGERIGWGLSRQVYTCKLLPDCVVKVEDDAGHFQNVIEWETWERVRGTSAEKWFAPCRWISPSGVVLVMAKTREPAPGQYPKQMPVFLSDLKPTNYGIYDGRLVCHDYGTNLLMEHGKSKRMRKADWWS